MVEGDEKEADVESVVGQWNSWKSATTRLSEEEGVGSVLSTCRIAAVHKGRRNGEEAECRTSVRVLTSGGDEARLHVCEPRRSEADE